MIDTLLGPLMWLIAWVMYGIHSGITALFNMSEGAGPAWVLAIIGLTIVVRIAILPLYNRQIKASREMQVMQPEIQRIQEKYKGKRDQISQQRMNEEMMALYRDRGTSPFASCMPMLIQMPILFALFRVLYAFPQIAEGTYRKDRLGPITQDVAQAFQDTTFFGAPLSASFGTPGENVWNVRIVAAILILFMSLTLFYTTRQLTMKNMPEKSLDPNNPTFKMQKYMMYGMPFIYLFTGFAFQIGVMVYWAAGNVWTIGQQSWFIRTNPTPGSKAYKERQARLKAKAEKRGEVYVEEDPFGQPIEEKKSGQRQQPMGKARSKKAAKGQRSGAAEEQDVANSAEEVESDEVESTEAEVRGKDGLTDEERARKRYERRQAERARSKAKQEQRKKKASQNQKKRNF